MIAFFFSLALQAGDPPPPAAPRPVEEPDAEAQDDDDGAAAESDESDEGEDQDEEKSPRPRRRPRARLPGPDALDDDTFTPVFWGANTGCALGGVLPATGATFGLGLFYGAGACGDVAGAVGGLSGALIAIPSLLVLGPCAAGGATLGASMGAVLSAQDPVTAALWTLPGIGMGVAGGAVATAGVLVTSTTDPELRQVALPLGTTLVIIGSAAALAAGPLAVAGATITQEPWEFDVDAADTQRLRDGGVEARHFSAPATPTAMAF